jgi:hypothetical protein
MKSNLEDTEWKDIHYFRVFPFLIVVADSSTHRHSASETNVLKNKTIVNKNVSLQV